jgi:hypothetical protein
MISHKYKCIFIHIPRTGGSSIEKFIQGQDQWNINPKEKHLTCSQTKEKYKEYWDDYFKFSFVRNPYERTVSCLNFSDYFGLSLDKNYCIDFSKYKEKFGFPKTIEYDHRFYLKKNITENTKLISNCIYSNILDLSIDRIFKFEELESSVKELRKILSISNQKFPTVQKGSDKLKTLKNQILKQKINIKNINELYLEDFKTYKYNIL